MSASSSRARRPATAWATRCSIPEDVHAVPMPAAFPKTEPGKRPVMLLTGASRGIGHATVKLFAMQRLAHPVLLAPGLLRQMPLAVRRRRSCADRSRRSRGHDARHRRDQGAAARRGRQAQRARQQRRHFAEGPNGARLGAATTSFNDWHNVFQVNFFAPIMLARGLLDELTGGEGRDRQRHLDRRLARASLRRRGLCAPRRRRWPR